MCVLLWFTILGLLCSTKSVIGQGRGIYSRTWRGGLFLLQNFELCFYFRVLAFSPEVDSLSPVTFSSKRKLRRWSGSWKWLIRTRLQPECLQSPVLLEGKEVLSWGKTATVRQQRGASLWLCAASRRGVRGRWKGRGGVLPWCTIQWKLNTDFEIPIWKSLLWINFGHGVIFRYFWRNKFLHPSTWN